MSQSIEEAMELLGVTADSDPATVARAYRRLARATHPDVSDQPDAAVRFAAVTTAYHQLTARATSAPSPGSGQPPRPPTAPTPAAPTWRGGWPMSPFSRTRPDDGTAIVAGPVVVQPPRRTPTRGDPGTGGV